MKCSTHPDRDAQGVCAYSGKPYCSEDLVEVHGKMYAKENLARVFSELKEEATKQPMVFMNAGGGGASSSSSAAASSASGTDPLPMMIGPQKSKMTALILCIFLGWLGGHRFYVGKTGTGILYLFTGGLMLIGVFFDLIAILTGGFRDNWGRPLV